MYYTIDKIISDVRSLMNENPATEALIECEDIATLTLNAKIESCIERCVKEVEMSAPVELLEPGKSLNGSFTLYPEDENGLMGGFMVLPDDFCRLISLKMSGWAYQLSTVVTENDIEYHAQKSEFGIKGSPSRPVAAIIQSPSGLILEFFSVTSGDDVTMEKGQYLPIKKIGDDETKADYRQIDISEKLYEEVCRVALRQCVEFRV